MTVALILLAVLAVLTLLLLLPVCLQVDYADDEVGVVLRAGPIRYRLLPAKEKTPEEQAAKAAKKQQKKAAAPERSKLEAVQAAAEKYCALVKQLCAVVPVVRRVLVIDEITVYVRFFDEDPAQLALRYGQAWAVIGVVMGTLSNLLRVKRREVCPMIDSAVDGFSLDAKLKLHITLLGALRILLKFVGQREKRQKNAAKAPASN